MGFKEIIVNITDVHTFQNRGSNTIGYKGLRINGTESPHVSQVGHRGLLKSSREKTIATQRFENRSGGK